MSKYNFYRQIFFVHSTALSFPQKTATILRYITASVYIKIQKITALCLSFFLSFAPIASAQSSFGPPLKVSAVDTIAGYSTQLKTSRGTPNEQVTFRVENPVGTVVELDAETNEIGVAEMDFAGFHTKKSGEYTVSAYYREYTTEAPMLTYFTVYPDGTSASKSTLSVNPTNLAANGEDTALISVTVKDKHGNPIAGHQLTLISSRGDDEIQEAVAGAATNKNGVKVYEISSSSAGLSYLTALDANTGVTLDQRAQVVFFEPEETAPRTTSNPLSANIFGNTDTVQPSGPVSRFELEFVGPSNQPNVATVGTDQNYFTITAVDADGVQVSNYTGTALLSVPDDENAVLPNGGQYTFRPQDEGSFQFDLAFQFSQTGTQTIEVYEFNPDTVEINRNIRGTIEIEVRESSSTPPINTENPGDDALQIKTPENNASYATSDVSLTGKGNPNTDLRVFLDDVEVLSQVPVDEDGVFFTTLSNVSNGSHSLYVQETAGDRNFSDTLSFNVDTTSPILQDVVVTPEDEVEVGQSLTVVVTSEPNLSEASVRIDAEKKVLREDTSKPGNYELSFVAPNESGQYPLDVTLVDAIGNESKFLSQATIRVVEEEQKQPEKPLRVTATPEEEAVKLTWEPAAGAVLYIVESGTSEFRLSEAASVPANKTSVVIDNLQGGDEYVFQIKAMNADGVFSEGSDFVTARPLFGAPQQLTVEAQAAESSMRVQWDESTQGANRYRIRYGISPTRYQEDILVAASQRSVVIPDLIPGVTYYVTVVAYANGEPTDEQYMQDSATPLPDQFHNAPAEPINLDVPSNAASGPEQAVLFIGASLLFVAFVMWVMGFRKRRALF